MRMRFAAAICASFCASSRVDCVYRNSFGSIRISVASNPAADAPYGDEAQRDRLWRALVDFGALTVGGDEGLGAVELCVISRALSAQLAPLPYLAEALRFPPAVLGFRSDAHAEAAALLPGAEVVVDPVLVTDCSLEGFDILACGPEPMLHAVRALRPDAQLACEAPMACGYGACYGCVVEIDNELKRLCVEGPVLACF